MFVLLALALTDISPTQAPAHAKRAPLTVDQALSHTNGVDVHVEQVIDAPADQVWALLGPTFADIGDWASLVEESYPTTTVPGHIAIDPDAPVQGRVTVTGFGAVEEYLIDYDDAAMTYTFRAHNIPGMLLYSQNHTQVHALDADTSKVTFDIHFVPKRKFMGGKIHDKLSHGLANLLAELKIYAETGQVAPAKAAMK
jgi:hypothetical protein